MNCESCVHAIAETGDVLVRRSLRRSQVLAFFSRFAPCLVGMEACGSAHYWARAITALNHTVRIMPPAYVKPYVKRHKTDAADAEAICEAVSRPTMRFVPIKTVAQQAAGMVLKTRELLVRQRVQASNALRGHMAELGVVAAKGRTSIGKLLAIIADRQDSSIPEVARTALQESVAQIQALTARVERLDQDVAAAVKADTDARRLTAIPGVGPIIAATVKAVVHDPAGFRSGRDASRLGGDDAERACERWQGAARGDLQTRQQTIAHVAHCGSDFHPQAGQAWPRAAQMDCRAAGKAAVQGCRRGAGPHDARTLWALLVKGGLYRAPSAMANA
jgi:transposase